MYYSPKTNGLKHNSCCQHMTHSSRLKQPIKAGCHCSLVFFSIQAPPLPDNLGIAMCDALFRLQPWTSFNERQDFYTVYTSFFSYIGSYAHTHHCLFKTSSLTEYRHIYINYLCFNLSQSQKSYKQSHKCTHFFLNSVLQSDSRETSVAHFIKNSISTNEYLVACIISLLQCLFSFAKHRNWLCLTFLGNNHPYSTFLPFLSFCLSFPPPAGLTVNWPMLFHHQVSERFPVLWHKSVVWLCSTSPCILGPLRVQTIFPWQFCTDTVYCIFSPQE